MGDETLPGMYAACQFDFGPDARMALTEEWVKSPNITLPAVSAWIQGGSNSSTGPFSSNQKKLSWLGDPPG